jgi:hypothetical protein
MIDTIILGQVDPLSKSTEAQVIKDLGYPDKKK